MTISCLISHKHRQALFSSCLLWCQLQFSQCLCNLSLALAPWSPIGTQILDIKYSFSATCFSHTGAVFFHLFSASIFAASAVLVFCAARGTPATSAAFPTKILILLSHSRLLSLRIFSSFCGRGIYVSSPSSWKSPMKSWKSIARILPEVTKVASQYLPGSYIGSQRSSEVKFILHLQHFPLESDSPRGGRKKVRSHSEKIYLRTATRSCQKLISGSA